MPDPQQEDRKPPGVREAIEVYGKVRNVSFEDALEQTRRDQPTLREFIDRMKALTTEAGECNARIHGHVEDLAAENERLREALEALRCYLGQPHHNLGEACGVDACVLCLAESTVATALASRTTGGPDA